RPAQWPTGRLRYIDAFLLPFMDQTDRDLAVGGYAPILSIGGRAKRRARTVNGNDAPGCVRMRIDMSGKSPAQLHHRTGPFQAAALPRDAPQNPSDITFGCDVS